jgi:hypothetical protein
MIWARYSNSAVGLPVRRSASARRSKFLAVLESIGTCACKAAASGTEAGGLSGEEGVREIEERGPSGTDGASGADTGVGGASDTGGFDPPAHANAIAAASSARTRITVTEWNIWITPSTRLSAAIGPNRETSGGVSLDSGERVIDQRGLLGAMNSHRAGCSAGVRASARVDELLIRTQLRL